MNTNDAYRWRKQGMCDLLLVGIGVALLLNLLLALIMAALMASVTHAGWIDSALFAVPLLMLYAVACGISAHYLCRAWALRQRGGVSILAVFCVSAVMGSAGWTGLGNAWNSLLQSTGHGIGMSAPLKASMFALGVFLYGLTVVGNWLFIERARARQLERSELEARVMAQDAELRRLRTQIDPHFLFNSLNSISALISSNPAGARAMTLRLAEFFRSRLTLEAHRKVTLAMELALALRFLAIEQARFGERLVVEQEVDDDALDCLLPPMILQQLVENVVKLGIGGLIEGGLVRIAAARAGSLLRLSVEIHVDEELPSAAASGLGLAGVRQRLATTYGARAAIHWSRHDKLFSVELTLPAESKEE